MKPIEEPAPFSGDETPLDPGEAMTKQGAACGSRGAQVPSWDPRLIDLDRATTYKGYHKEFLATARENGVEVTQPSVHDNSKARQKRKVDQVDKAITRAKNTGVKQDVTFPGSLVWLNLRSRPQRSAGLVDATFDDFAGSGTEGADTAQISGIDP